MELKELSTKCYALLVERYPRTDWSTKPYAINKIGSFDNNPSELMVDYRKYNGKVFNKNITPDLEFIFKDFWSSGDRYGQVYTNLAGEIHSVFYINE